MKPVNLKPFVACPLEKTDCESKDELCPYLRDCAKIACRNKKITDQEFRKINDRFERFRMKHEARRVR